MADRDFWQEQLEHPRDANHLVFPCHHMSIACTTPLKARSLDNPSGDEADAEIHYYYNTMAHLMFSRIWILRFKGAMILTEQRFLSHLYFLRVARGFLGASGVFAFRATAAWLQGRLTRSREVGRRQLLCGATTVCRIR